MSQQNTSIEKRSKSQWIKDVTWINETADEKRVSKLFKFIDKTS